MTDPQPLSPQEEAALRQALSESNGPNDDVGYAVFADAEDAETVAARLFATLDAARAATSAAPDAGERPDLEVGRASALYEVGGHEDELPTATAGPTAVGVPVRQGGPRDRSEADAPDAMLGVPRLASPLAGQPGGQPSRETRHEAHEVDRLTRGRPLTDDEIACYIADHQSALRHGTARVGDEIAEQLRDAARAASAAPDLRAAAEAVLTDLDLIRALRQRPGFGYFLVGTNAHEALRAALAAAEESRDG